MTTSSEIEAQVLKIVELHAQIEGALLPILHDVQRAFHHIPRDAIAIIAEALNLSRAEVYGVVSFYSDFREAPAGRRHLKICRAEACQARGGRAMAEGVLTRFGVDWDGTTSDGELTVSPVYCLGLCSVAPAVSIDDQPVGRVTLSDLLQRLEQGR